MAAEWPDQVGSGEAWREDATGDGEALDRVSSGEAWREDATEDGEARPCSGGARAAQGFSRFLIVCTLRSVVRQLAGI